VSALAATILRVFEDYNASNQGHSMFGPDENNSSSDGQQNLVCVV
jgi:hypothetical protein